MKYIFKILYNFIKYIGVPLIIFVQFLLLTPSANAVQYVEGMISEMRSGVCPRDLRKVERAKNHHYGCDKMRVGSLEHNHCITKVGKANEVIYEYNKFLRRCSGKNY